MKLPKIIFAILACVPGGAQQVSIRPYISRSGPFSEPVNPVGYYCRKCPLKDLISLAFDTAGHRIVGPSFLKNEYFDVDVQKPVPGGPDRATALRNALEDRFHLRAHRENREMAGFELLIASRALQLKPSGETAPDDSPAPMLRIPDSEGAALPDASGRWAFRQYNGGLTVQGSETIEAFARQLSFTVNKPVSDLTGLKGKYQFNFAGFAAAQGRHLPLRVLIKGIQGQLGLRLEAKTELFEVLVIDQIDRIPGKLNLIAVRPGLFLKAC